MRLEHDIETDYETVINGGQVLTKRSPHNSGTNCDCDMSAPQARYRDVTIEYEGRKYHYYHSTPVVIELEDNKYRLTNGTWTTMSTKERINRYLPGTSYKVRSKGGDWVVETPDGDIEFKNGMVIEI